MKAHLGMFCASRALLSDVRGGACAPWQLGLLPLQAALLHTRCAFPTLADGSLMFLVVHDACPEPSLSTGS